MAEEKSAKRVYTLDDIKFKEENKTMAIVSWISIVGIIMLFVEKKDLFVRYIGAQVAILGVASLILPLIPVIGWVVGPFIALILFVVMIVGMVKTSKGERFDIPFISDLALKLMSGI